MHAFLVATSALRESLTGCPYVTDNRFQNPQWHPRRISLLRGPRFACPRSIAEHPVFVGRDFGAVFAASEG